MKFTAQVISLFLPWRLKRRWLEIVFRYQLARSARIGFSWFFPTKLVMEEHSRIGHFNIAIRLNCVTLASYAVIWRNNWITGYPKGDLAHFSHLEDRDPSLILNAHSSITKGHHFDCTDRISIGSYSTIAGYRSQFLTHSVDIVQNRQSASPIEIGSYCFVGTDVVVLGGARLPSRSVLGAKSLLNKQHKDELMLYGGIPARPLKSLPTNAGYFNRREGFVS